MIVLIDDRELCWLIMLANWQSLASGSTMKGKRGFGQASKVDVASAILSFLKATRHVGDHINGGSKTCKGRENLTSLRDKITVVVDEPNEASKLFDIGRLL